MEQSVERRILISAAAAIAIASAPAGARADDSTSISPGAVHSLPSSDRTLPAFRWGAAVTAGFVYPIGASVPHPDGTSSDVFSAGVGFDLRCGAQLTEWLAVDLHGTAKSIILAGDARIGGQIEIAPVDVFAASFGAGIGSLYDLNFFWPNPSVHFWAGFLRLEARLPRTPLSRQREHLTIGAEGQLGRALSGDAPPNAAVVGARMIVGLLWH